MHVPASISQPIVASQGINRKVGRLPIRPRDGNNAGCRASKVVGAVAGSVAGLTVAALPPLLLATRSDAAKVLAPVLGQALTTVGASMAGFCYVSKLRRLGGDPYGYGLWGAAGLGTAVAVPALGYLTSATSGAQVFNASLFRGCLGSSASIIGVGMVLQSLIDRGALHSRGASQLLRCGFIGTGALFAAAIAWQMTYLLSHLQAQAEQCRGLLPEPAEVGLERQKLYVAAFSMAVIGTVMGAYAIRHGRELSRVAGIGVALASLPVAFYGAAL